MDEGSPQPSIHIIGDGNIIGDNNIVQIAKVPELDGGIYQITQQVLVGDYERLRDARIDPTHVIERVELEHFTGRKWLSAEVDAFLHANDRGYLVIEAQAGAGKTTFLAWLAQQRDYVSHFCQLARGPDSLKVGLRNLASQIIEKYRVGDWAERGVLPTAAARPDFFAWLLRSVSQRLNPGQKIVLVIDALDEVEGQSSDNVLGLPSVLPPGVYIIASQRPVPITLDLDPYHTPHRLLSLSSYQAEDAADLRRFLTDAAARPGIKQMLAQSGSTSSHFVSSVLDAAGGSWLYAQYLLLELARGDRQPLDFSSLPHGMTSVYLRESRMLRARDEVAWGRTYLPLLATIAAAQESLSLAQIRMWARLSLEDDRLLSFLHNEWHAFILVRGDGPTACYTFYHSSLREFFEQAASLAKSTGGSRLDEDLLTQIGAATRLAHGRIADSFLEQWGSLPGGLPKLEERGPNEAQDVYGRRHLTYHLEKSGRNADLHHLLRVEHVRAEEISVQRDGLGGLWDRLRAVRRVERRYYYKNAWYSHRAAATESQEYFADVERAWRLAEQDFHSSSAAEAARVLGTQVRYALILASMTSLSMQTPPSLVIAMVQRGLWTPLQALDFAAWLQPSERKAELLLGMSGLLPESLLQRALSLAQEMRSGEVRSQLQAQLVRRLAQLGYHREALQLIQRFDADSERTNALTATMPFLMGSALSEAVSLAESLQEEIWQTRSLTALAPRLAEQGMCQQALRVADRISDEWYRARAVAGIVAHLPESLIADGRRLCEEMSWSVKGRPCAEIALRVAEFGDMAAAIRMVSDLRWEDDKAQVLQKLAPRIPESLIGEGITAARTIRHPMRLADTLSALACRLCAFGEPEAGLQLAREIAVHAVRARTLDMLEHHSEARFAARQIEDPLVRAQILVQLNLPEEALAAVYCIPDLEQRARTLASLGRTPEAVEVAATIKTDMARARILLHLGKTEGAAAIIRGAPAVLARAHLIDALAADIPEDVKAGLLHEALTMVEATTDKELRYRLLSLLAPHLPSSMLQRAWTLCNVIEDKLDGSF